MNTYNELVQDVVNNALKDFTQDEKNILVEELSKRDSASCIPFKYTYSKQNDRQD